VRRLTGSRGLIKVKIEFAEPRQVAQPLPFLDPQMPLFSLYELIGLEQGSRGPALDYSWPRAAPDCAQLGFSASGLDPLVCWTSRGRPIVQLSH